MMSSVRHAILTIGHSTHSLEMFIGLLARHGVTALADVRSTPYSRFTPQFNREALELGLKGRGIEYVFLGRELGARPDDPSCYENGRVRYARLAQTVSFRSGLDRILRYAATGRITLMCAEKEPLDCHRTFLVARALDERGVSVGHILSDGPVESHDETLERLLDIVGLSHDDLFQSKQQRIEEAMARQESRIAHVNETLTADTVREGP